MNICIQTAEVVVPSRLPIPVVPASQSVLVGPTFPRLVGFYDLLFDLLRQEVQCGTRLMRFERVSYKIMLYLACNYVRSEPVCREELETWVYGRVLPKKSHALNTHIYRVRHELKVMQSRVSIPNRNQGRAVEPGYRLTVAH